ncbi:MAG TPA: right-handed parallel beta-helix repeat-containing protein, partial [Verrucomicrobiae bacterium]|nr:right-handed parallel beta-helix repeat-containing protein [Verrucomicrobiae bacterium]
PFLTIGKGVNAVGNGGQLYIRGGVYALSSKLRLSNIASSTNRIRIWAYPGEQVVIDSTGNSSDGISVSGDGYYLKGLTVAHAGHNGINISGASNIVELCTTCSNANTGLHITGDLSTSYNLILNCDSFHNYDAATHGQNADGFSAKWVFGPGNVFSGCRAWENADDGWDLWMGTNTVVITNCWAIRNGTNVFGDPAWEGNGNGFKLGGNYVGTPHRLVRSLAVLNMANGVDQNNNLAGQTLDNNTAWANRSRNFSMAHGVNTTPHVVRNNISFGGGSGDSFTSGTLSTNNSWQVLSPGPNAADFQSLDYSALTGSRQADGSLPDLPFLKPVPNGRLVDKGVNTGDPFKGTAPDLGAFEVQ